MAERFERHSRTFALVTVVSRVTGLGRDAALSRVFGATGVMDAFFFAFIIPNLFRRLFGEGAVAAAFLRSYARLDAGDRDMARRLATLTVASLLVVLGGITLAGEAVLAVIPAGDADARLSLRLLMIMLPYMPLVCLVAVLGAMLQVHGRFGPTAAVPIVLNLFLIAATVGLVPLLGADPRRHVTAVAAAVMVAGVVQLTWMVLALRGRRWLVRDVGPARAPMGAMLRQAGPMILGLGVLQLNAMLDGLIASYPTTVGPTILGVAYPLQEGAMSAVSFAQRLYQFPLGVFGIAVATAIYPALARQADDAEAFAATVRRGLRLVLYIGLPASAGLMLVGPLLIRVLFEGGQFDAADSRRVAWVLYGYAAGVWAYSLIHVLTRAYYARGDTRTPVAVAVGVVGLNLLLNCTLIWTPLREAGLAWSTAICAVIQAAVLLALGRRLAVAVPDAAVIAGAARSLALTVGMAVAVGALLGLLPEAATWTGAAIELALVTGAGAVIVLGGGWVLGLAEPRWLLSRG